MFYDGDSNVPSSMLLQSSPALVLVVLGWLRKIEEVEMFLNRFPWLFWWRHFPGLLKHRFSTRPSTCLAFARGLGYTHVHPRE